MAALSGRVSDLTRRAATDAETSASAHAKVILVGEHMAPLANALEGRVDFVHVPDAATALDRLTAVLKPGDRNWPALR